MQSNRSYRRLSSLALTATILGSVVAMTSDPALASPIDAADVAEAPAAADTEPTHGVIELETVGMPDDVAPMVVDSADGSVRSRYVEAVASELIERLGSNDVTIALFEDVVVPFGSSGVLSTGEGDRLTWSATTPDAIATLSFADDGVRGSISVGSTTYSVVPASGTTHLILEEGRALPNETEAIAPPGDVRNDASGPSSSDPPLDVDPTPASDASTPVVRVLTVYDDAARTYFGGDAQAVASLSATIDEVNAAYARSGANVVMQSAAIEHVVYAGTGVSANVELNRITNTSDGYLDAVHARRDALEADLVVFVVPLDQSTCGQAWLLTPPVTASDAAYGFSVVRPDCARSNLTFAHETGHNLGAGHGPPDPVGVVPYANGYRSEAAGYRSIMAYNATTCPSGVCTRVAYFSSPTRTYNGQPIGSSTQNNACVLSRLAPSVAQYRGGPNGTGSGGCPIVPLAPKRLLDTRGGSKVGSVDGTAGPLTLNVLNRGGLPGVGVGALAINVTVTEGENPTRGGGYVTVYPCGTKPTASNLNFVSGQTIPNSVIAPVSSAGDVCFYVYGRAHLVVDVSGYFPTGVGIVPLTPARLLDTRTGGGKVGSVDGSAGPVTVNVLNRNGLPAAGVGAAALNVTVADGENPILGGGFVTVYPCGTRPNASNLNFVSGQTIPNSVIAPVSTSGDICFYVYGRAHLVVDVSGYFPSGTGIVPLTPARLLDTRDGGGKVGSFDGSAGPVTLNVLNRDGLPAAGIGAVALNVTVTDGENPVLAGGFVTVYPCGTMPEASNLNFVGGQTIPNSVIAPVSAAGDICFYVYGRAHLVVDVSGYFTT